MPVYIIEKHEMRPDGAHHRLYIESDHSTLAALTADLRTGPVCVSHLFCHFDHAEQAMVITSREDLMITTYMVFSARVPDAKFIEFEEEKPRVA